jgi:hypothetical protein
VLTAGVSAAWLDAGEVCVEGLPTWWGPLGYVLRRAGPDALRFELSSGLRPPPGGIIVRPPLPRPLAGVELDGVSIADFDAGGITLRQCPASIVMRY